MADKYCVFGRLYGLTTWDGYLKSYLDTNFPWDAPLYYRSGTWVKDLLEPIYLPLSFLLLLPCVDPSILSWVEYHL